MLNKNAILRHLHRPLKKAMLFALVSLVLLTCRPIRDITVVNQPEYFQPLSETLRKAIKWERRHNSKDVSYKHLIKIGEGLYPNLQGYNLSKVKRFLRPQTNDSLANSIEYFASPDDSVRVILHEWDFPYKREKGLLIDQDPNDEKTKARFDKKFAALEREIISILGQPDSMNVKDGFANETVRDDIKWIKPGYRNVYLLMFKRDKNIYREIRMVVYIK